MNCTSSLFYRTVTILFLFLIRACASGVIQAVYVYTPEVYPTKIWAFSLGFHTAAAQLGAITTPYIAQVTLFVCMLSCKECRAEYLHNNYCSIPARHVVHECLIPVSGKHPLMSIHILHANVTFMQSMQSRVAGTHACMQDKTVKYHGLQPSVFNGSMFVSLVLTPGTSIIFVHFPCYM